MTLSELYSIFLEKGATPDMEVRRWIPGCKELKKIENDDLYVIDRCKEKICLVHLEEKDQI